MAPLDRSSEYQDIKGSKIRMKETKSEKADRLYRKEQKRQAREASRISRANGYAVSPPRQNRSGSISPPRNPIKRTYPEDNDEEIEGSGEWMGGFGRRAKEELEKREWQDKLNWMSRGFDEDPFFNGSFDDFEDIHIPKRFREAAGLSGLAGPGPSTFASRRRAADEVDLNGGLAPPLGRMTDEEYTEWIREGMYRIKHKSEIEASERRRKEIEEKERLKEMEREKAEKEEEKKIKSLKKQKGLNEEKKRKDQRRRWVDRWKNLTERDNDIVELQLSFDDIPWPIHRMTNDITIDQLNLENIRNFVYAVAEDSAENEKVDLRKTVRDAIRNYHPDRFNSRILIRVRDKDKDLVKEAVVLVSGLLNDLVREVR
ncbi:uncharacterized protein I206_102173 [Kwoniella pini CBS 10737]|uniref:Uncharacterized protein n=1 Tax=Kwoniella pini CBS 10737 TaxID=1296096 RepID=A0A1B9HUM2_9TREE|nr:uncharacterized protein I206_06732 [Kwoniella pini CBS 10737]OCF46958.1 hypothetical protein I206_06732 [Kwoniella pini CBS 10737]